MNLSPFGSSTILSFLRRPQEANPSPRYKINRFLDWRWEGGAGEDAAKITCGRKAVENVC